MKHVIYLFISYFFLIGCTEDRKASIQADCYPEIFPDYKEVCIPTNIAPFNFKVEKSSYIQVSFTGDSQILFTVKGKSDVRIPEKKWKNMLLEYAGKKIQIIVSIWDITHPEGIQYKPFSIYISSDSIDPWIAYRLIEPGYESWHEMGIYQRELSSFHENKVISSNMEEKGCVNCHSFCNYSPTNWMFHARTSKGGTILIKDDQARKIQLSQIGSPVEGTYPYWHPSGEYILFSTNKTRQSFYSKNTNLIEVYDLESNLVLYNTKQNQVTIDPRFATSISLETFPAWSPDGKYLYYCVADSKPLPQDLKALTYSVCRVTFNPETGLFGNAIDTLRTTVGKSASFPRISPDNKYLLYTESDFATFPIWHKEADLKMIALQDSIQIDTTPINSPEAESYHSWSSNGRWIIFSSRRLDGLYTRFFIAHFDSDGKFSKPFLLPQENPDDHYLRMKSFNIPEFIKGEITIPQSQLDHIISD